MRRVGIILQAHEREGTLPAVMAQLDAFRALGQTRVVALLDRPTERVERLVADGLHADDVLLKVPFAVVGPAGERFPEAQNLALDVLQNDPPEWVWWQPDDVVFEPGWETEFGCALESPEVDVWFVRNLFYWDAERIRLDVFPVCDPLLWRWVSRARYEPRRQLLCPPSVLEAARSTGRVRRLTHRLLDRGFATPEDRDACWRRAKQAGKIDHYTTALVTEPKVLVTYEQIRDRKDIPHGTT